jgi:hypothetical protein
MIGHVDNRHTRTYSFPRRFIVLNICLTTPKLHTSVLLATVVREIFHETSMK